MRGTKRTPKKPSKPTPKKLYSPSPGKQSDIRKFCEKTPPRKLLLPLLEEEPKVDVQRNVAHLGSGTVANVDMDDVKQSIVRPDNVSHSAVTGPSASLTREPTSECSHIHVSVTVTLVTTPRDVQSLPPSVPVETGQGESSRSGSRLIFQESKTIPITENCEDITNAARQECDVFMRNILGISPTKPAPSVSGASSSVHQEPEAPTCKWCGTHPETEVCPVDEELDAMMLAAGSIQKEVEQPTENLEAEPRKTPKASDTSQSLSEGADVGAGSQPKKSQGTDVSQDANGSTLTSAGRSLGSLSVKHEPHVSESSTLCGAHAVKVEECPVATESDSRGLTAENAREEAAESVRDKESDMERRAHEPLPLGSSQNLGEGDIGKERKVDSPQDDPSHDALENAGRSLGSSSVKPEPHALEASMLCGAHAVKVECPADTESDPQMQTTIKKELEVPTEDKAVGTNRKRKAPDVLDSSHNVSEEGEHSGTGRKRKKIMQLEISQEYLSDIGNTCRKAVESFNSSPEVADTEPMESEEEGIGGTGKKRKKVQQLDSSQDAIDDDDRCLFALTTGGGSLDSSQGSDIGVTPRKAVKPLESSLEIADNDIANHSGGAETLKASRDGSDADEDDDVTKTARKRKRRCRSTALESSDESGCEENIVATPRKLKKRVLNSGDEEEEGDDGTRTRRSTRVMSLDRKRGRERNAKLRRLQAKKSKEKRKLMSSSSESEGSASSAPENGYNTDGFVVSDSELPELDSASSNSEVDGNSDDNSDDDESSKPSRGASADEAGEGSEGKELVELEPEAGPSAGKEAGSSLESQEGEEGQSRERGGEAGESSSASDSSSSEEEDSAPRLTDLSMSFDEAFKVYIDFLLAAAVDPDLLKDQNSAGRDVSVAIKKVKREVNTYCQSFVSSWWQKRFKRLLETYPNYQVGTFQSGEAKCMACQRDRYLRFVVTLNGSPYDLTTLEDITDDESSDEDDVMEDTSAYDMAGCTSSREFVMGDHCHQKSQMFHQLFHLERWLYRQCREKMEAIRQRTRGEVSDKDLIECCLYNKAWVQKLLDQTKACFKTG